MPRLGWRWAIAAARLCAIIAWFLAILPPHVLCTLAGRRDIVPPLFLAGIGWLAGLRIRTHGRPAAGRLLLIANHLSWLDILALAHTARAAFVAHGGLAQFRFLRWLCEQNDTVFITRDRRGTVAMQVAQIERALAERRLAIFIEGTTGDGRALLPFKSSLLSAAERVTGHDDALAVQPVALDYREAEEIAWVGAEPGMHNVMRILARTRPVRLDVRFCDPLTRVQRADRKHMAAAAQAAVARALRRGG